MSKQWKPKESANKKELTVLKAYAQKYRTNTQDEINKLIKELDKTKLKLMSFNRSYPCNQIRTTKLAQNLINLVDKICNLKEKIMGEM